MRLKFLIGLLLFTSLSYSQFNYQSLIRDTNGNVVVNTDIQIRFGIIYDSPTATPIYSEIHQITTPSDGVINILIGDGVAQTGSSSFTSIDWSKIVYVKQEVEIDNSGSFIDFGTNKLNSVPIAEYARKTSVSSQTFVSGDSNIQIGTTIGQTGGGHNNIAIGKNSLSNANGTSRNISIGENSMKDNNGGNTNVSIGSLSMSRNSTGNSNVSLGYAASMFNTEGNRNVNIGEYSGYNNETGSRNVNIGYRANYQDQGTTAVNHLDVTTIGANTRIIGDYIENSTAIGANAVVDTHNTIQLGDNNITLVKTSGNIDANDFLINGNSLDNRITIIESTSTDSQTIDVALNGTTLELLPQNTTVSATVDLSQINQFETIINDSSISVNYKLKDEVRMLKRMVFHLVYSLNGNEDGDHRGNFIPNITGNGNIRVHSMITNPGGTWSTYDSSSSSCSTCYFEGEGIFIEINPDSVTTPWQIEITNYSNYIYFYDDQGNDYLSLDESGGRLNNFYEGKQLLDGGLQISGIGKKYFLANISSNFQITVTF